MRSDRGEVAADEDEAGRRPEGRGQSAQDQYVAEWKQTVAEGQIQRNVIVENARETKAARRRSKRARDS